VRPRADLSERWRNLDLAWVAALLLVGVGSRIIIVSLFPARPTSDFAMLLELAKALRDGGPGATHPSWRWFNGGVPTLLSLALLIVPGSPEAIARCVTAFVTGIVGALAFLLLRPAVPRWVACLAGGGLALWPGQIAFSAVIAQDNWVIAPTVASACLGVRVLRTGRAHPVLAAVLWALGAYIRQEMLVVLLPAALAGAGLRADQGRRGRVLAWAGAAAVLFLAIAGQRYAATGRFSVTTAHGGTSMLGSYVPGVALDWSDPTPFAATLAPPLRDDPERFARSAFGIGLRLIAERPLFHLAKRVAATLESWRYADSAALYWAFHEPDAARDLGNRARRFGGSVGMAASYQILALHAVFLASTLLAIVAWRADVLLVLAVIALKIGLHGALVTQARFFLPVVALEFVAISLAAESAVRRPWLAACAVGLGAGMVAGLVAGSGPLTSWVVAHEHDIQRTYRFTLRAGLDAPVLRCEVTRGWVRELGGDSVRLELSRWEPEPGDTARANCVVAPGAPPSAMIVGVLDEYAPGGFPDRIVQRILTDGREVLRNDLAGDPGAGWREVPVAMIGTEPRGVTFEVLALKPDHGPAWGRAATTKFRVRGASP
jgi:hypothetical protein